MSRFSFLSITTTSLIISLASTTQAADRTLPAASAVMSSTISQLHIDAVTAPQPFPPERSAMRLDQQQTHSQGVQQRRALMREMRTIGLSAATIAR